MDEKKKPPFFKRVFALKDVHLPPISLRFPNWKTPEINLRMPSFGGWQPPNLKIASVRGMTITGGVWKIGILGGAIGLLVTGFAIGTSVVFTQAASHFPDPAIYNVAAVKPDHTLKVGDDWVVPEDATLDERRLITNTLKINMRGARASNITINDVDIGATFGSATDTIKIIGATGKVLECETVVLENVTATKITIADSQFHTMNILNNQASGISIGGTLSSTPAAITVQSERGAVSIPSVGGGGSSFDKIEISTITASSQCKKLTISNVRAYGGGISIANLHAKTFTLSNSTFGADASLDTFELVISATTLYSTMTASNNVEKSIIVK